MEKSNDLIDLLLVKLQEIINISLDYQVKGPLPGLKEALKFPWGSEKYQPTGYIYGFEKEIRNLVVADARFLRDAVRFIGGGNGGAAFYPNFFAGQLIRRAIESESALEAIEWFKKVVTTEGADGLYITAMWNFPVSSEIHIADNISLLPFDELPESRQKKMFLENQPGTSLISSILNWIKPSSALVYKYHVKPFLLDPDDADSSEYSRINAEVDDILHLLVLVGPSAPIMAANWFNFIDPDLEFAIPHVSRGGQIIELMPLRTVEKFFEFDEFEIRALVTGFTKLDDDLKRRLKVAIDRIKQARMRHSFGDAAVEVSIAFETLLGDAERSKITSKLISRAGEILGGSKEDIARNKLIVRRTYEIRSKRVHEGLEYYKKIKLNNIELAGEEIVNEACKLCANIVKIIIKNGKMPIWK